jgi:hypothetical protein
MSDDLTSLFSEDDWGTIRIARLLALHFAERDMSPLHVEVSVKANGFYSTPTIVCDILFHDLDWLYDEQQIIVYCARSLTGTMNIYGQVGVKNFRFDEEAEYEDCLNYINSYIEDYATQVLAWQKGEE